jgi:hypothetical protein
VPGRLPGNPRIHCAGQKALFESCLLGPDGDFGIAVCGFQTRMAEPCSNGVYFHAGFKQVDGRAVPPNMRRDASLLAVGAVLDNLASMTPDDLIDSKAGQSSAPGTSKNRPVRSTGRPLLSAQPSQQGCCLIPQGTHPPLVSLAVQAYTRVRIKLNVCRSKVRCLLHARAAVIQE